MASTLCVILDFFLMAKQWKEMISFPFPLPFYFFFFSPPILSISLRSKVYHLYTWQRFLALPSLTPPQKPEFFPSRQGFIGGTICPWKSNNCKYIINKGKTYSGVHLLRVAYLKLVIVLAPSNITHQLPPLKTIIVAFM